MKNSAKRSSPTDWVLALLGISLGLATAFLVVNGGWLIIPALLILLPGLVVLHRYPFVTIIVWLVLMPFLLHTDMVIERRVYWIIHRGLPVLTLLIVVISSALRIHPRKLPRLGVPEMAMAAYVGVTLVSIYFQNNTPLATAYQFYDRIIVAICLYLIIRLVRPGEDQLTWLLPVAVFITYSQFAIGTLSWIAPGFLPNDWLDKAGERTYGSLSNTSVYTAALTFTGLLLLYAAFQRKPGFIRKLFILAFGLALFSSFFSFSRASWLAGFLVIAGLVYRYPRFSFKLGLAVLPVIVLAFNGVIFGDQIRWAQQRLYSAQSEESALSRLPVFYAALQMFEAKPIFGWGYGNFDRFDRGFQSRVGDLINAEKDHASHNYYLQTIAEQGLIGLLLFLLPPAWWLIQMIKKYPALPKHGFLSRDLLFLLWLVLLHEFVVNNFANLLVVYGHGLWWLTLGLIGYLTDSVPAPIRVAAEQPSGSAGWTYRLPDRLRRTWR